MFKRKNGKSKQKQQPRQPHQQQQNPVLTADVTVIPGSHRDPGDDFSARPSNRAAAASNQVQADGDTWQEALAVCEMPSKSSAPNGALTIRSYYENVRSGTRVWDEPPSGASHILPASDEMRRMAKAQLQELQVVSASSGQELTPGGSPKKKFGLFRNNNTKKNDTSDADRRIRYRPDSRVGGTDGGMDGMHDYAGTVNDQNLQQAIALSLSENAIGPNGTPTSPTLASRISEVNKLTPQEQEELAMAMSLSMANAGEDETAGENGVAMAPPGEELSEEEMLNLAMAESRIDAERAGYNIEDGNKLNREGDLLGLTPSPASNRKVAPGQSAKPPPNHDFPAFHSHSQPLQPVASAAASLPAGGGSFNPFDQFGASPAAGSTASAPRHTLKSPPPESHIAKPPPQQHQQSQYGQKAPPQQQMQMQPYYAPKQSPHEQQMQPYYAPKQPPQEQYQPQFSLKKPPPQYSQQSYQAKPSPQSDFGDSYAPKAPPQHMLKSPPPSSDQQQQPFVASSQYSNAMLKSPPPDTTSPSSLRKMSPHQEQHQPRRMRGGHKKPSTQDAAGFV